MVDLAISAMLSLLMSSSVDFAIPSMFFSFPVKKTVHNALKEYIPENIHFSINHFLYRKWVGQEGGVSFKDR